MPELVGYMKGLKMRRLAIAPALAAAMTLVGCGSGVQLEGPGFEAIGLTGKKQVEKKVPDRAPLLIPPDSNRLPEPAPRVATTRPGNWPSDPDIILKAKANEAAKTKQAYEDGGDWGKKGGIDEFEKLSYPIERRSGGILDRIYKSTNKSQGAADDRAYSDSGR